MHQNKKSNRIWIFSVVLILAAAMSRLLPHPYNFSPIAGMALLGGAVFENKKLAFLVPLGALFISDVCFSLFTTVPGFYGPSQLVNYAAFTLIVWLGMIAIKKINAKNIIFTSLGASALFFILSNFGVWLVAGGIPPYTADSTGLVNAYILGIPFFGNTIIGDLVYSGILFGIYSIVKHYTFVPEKTVHISL